MQSSNPPRVFRISRTPLGWDVVCDGHELDFISPGLYQTEGAAKAEAARLDVLYTQ